MNCKQCQEEILESLAADASVLAPAVLDHRNSCTVCSEFYKAQWDLFRSLDDGLKSLANQPVPPSLFPRVRTRMDEQPGGRGLWAPAWGLAATITVALLLFGVGRKFHPAVNHPDISDDSSAVLQNVVNPAPVLALVQQPKPSKDLPGRSAHHVSSTVPSAAVPEVVVLAEEREAFARFVSEVPQNREAALALTRPAPAAAGDLREVALLKIEELDLKPLKEAESE